MIIHLVTILKKEVTIAMLITFEYICYSYAGISFHRRSLYRWVHS